MSEGDFKLKPYSLVILSELSAASRVFETMLETGNTYRMNATEYERLSSSAETKLNELALKDPIEATRIYARSGYFDEGIDPGSEVYLGHGIIIDREELQELDTPEKRAAYIQEVIDS